jgi:hypothetical protein
MSNPRLRLLYPTNKRSCQGSGNGLIGTKIAPLIGFSNEMEVEAMRNQEIPSEQWVPFFDNLSKRHQGEHVTIELMGRDIGDQKEAQNQELLGITVDPPTGACKIEVMAGDASGINMAHEIAHPVHVRLAKSDKGQDAALEIESDSGPSTLLRFLSTSEVH